MKKKLITLLIIQIILQNTTVNTRVIKKTIIEKLGTYYSKIANKGDIKEPKVKKKRYRRYRRPRRQCRIQTGSKSTEYKWNSNHPFVKSTGSREIFYYVPFYKAFPFGKPEVKVALSGYDISKHSNARITGSVVWKGKYGFVLKISTWADSKVFYANYSFTAHHGCY